MTLLLFESAARPLLLAHAVVGFTAVGATTHHAVYALLVARGRTLARQLRRFGWIGPLALCTQLALGLALYPTYRVRVRAAFLDKSAPAVAQLFDFKEHLAALSLALVLAAALAGRALASRTELTDAADGPELGRPALRWSVAALSCTGALFVWTAALIGLYVTARHPVGTP